jgi:DNA polymerase-3 subunit gamma/tau
MKRDNLNTMFGNILSKAAGFSPQILAIAQEDWVSIRAEFSAKAKGQKHKKSKPKPAQFQKNLDFWPTQLKFEMIERLV